MGLSLSTKEESSLYPKVSAHAYRFVLTRNIADINRAIKEATPESHPPEELLIPLIGSGSGSESASLDQ